MKQKLLTTYEASLKSGFSTGYLRVLMQKGAVRGRQAKLTPKRAMWMIEEDSLKEYLSHERKPGRKPKSKS